MHDSIIYILAQRGIAASSTDSFTLQDDGEGAYIAQWNESLGQQPSASEIAAAAAPAKTKRDKDAHNAPVLAEIAALDAKRLRPSAEMALAFANGVAPDPADVARLNALTAEIAALRAGLMP